ncbi:MAG TPA: hypothetical protein VIM33_03860 [Gaiellaceae bacterium]
MRRAVFIALTLTVLILGAIRPVGLAALSPSALRSGVAASEIAFRAEAQLAFTRNDHAWAMRSDGRGQHRLPIKTLPAESPDGKWLAWWTSSSTRSRLMVARSDWSGTHAIAEYDYQPCFAPQWSPDSRRISYTVDCDLDNTRVFVIDRVGSRRRELSARKWNLGGEWSPDGRKLLLVSASPQAPWWFYVVDAGTLALRAVPHFHFALGGHFRWTWSPDGRTVFVEDDTRLLRLDTKTGRSKELSPQLFNARSVVVSPDGRWIAYQAVVG